MSPVPTIGNSLDHRGPLPVRKRPRVRPAIVAGHLPMPAQHILIRRQPLEPHRPPRMQLARTNPHLRAEAVAEAVGEPRGSVVKHACSIDLSQKSFSSR